MDDFQTQGRTAQLQLRRLVMKGEHAARLWLPRLVLRIVPGLWFRSAESASDARLLCEALLLTSSRAQHQHDPYHLLRLH